METTEAVVEEEVVAVATPEVGVAEEEAMADEVHLRCACCN